MINETLKEAWRGFVSTHEGDLSYVHGPSVRKDVTEPLQEGAYNLVLPTTDGLEAMMVAEFVVWACMDKRQVAQVANQLGIDGRSRIMVTTAGGPEQRGKRLNSGVAFWSALFNATNGNVDAAFVVHNERCGGAVVQEGEAVVNSWLKSGIESKMMLQRGGETIKRIRANSPKRQAISLGLSHIDHASGQFENVYFR